MRLIDIKAEIESTTDFRFGEGIDVLERDELCLIGLPKKCEISLHISGYSTTGKPFVALNGSDNRKGYSGFGFPCDTTEEIIKRLQVKAEEYGWKQPAQISLF